MLIEPNTYIRLIKNCPLNNKYEHTLYFNTPNEQHDYFINKEGITFQKQSYQRFDKGVLTVATNIGAVYNCNYMMFRNESFEKKWFYAFVTRVEYVNNNACRVYYQIDIMQTWHFNYELMECLVSREHSKTDAPGDNLVAENINISEYVYDWPDYNYPHNIYRDDNGNLVHGRSMEELSLVIMYDPGLLQLDQAIASNIEQFNRTEAFYGGVYQGVRFFCIPYTVFANADTAASNVIQAINALTDSIIACFSMPTIFVPPKNGDAKDYYLKYPFYINRNTSFGGYTPKNNKLFTFPYTCAYLTANRGSGSEYAFERFNAVNGSRAVFCAVGSFGANPSAIAYPNNYAGCEEYLEGAITIPQFPLCTWTSDDLVDWLNNAMFAAASAIGLALPTAANAYDTPVSRIRDMANDTNNSYNLPSGSLYTNNGLKAHYAATRANHQVKLNMLNATLYKREPSEIHGNGDTNLLMGCEHGRCIYALIKRIREEDARVIDDYFTMYGYATNRVKIPNRTARPYWNYIKTEGCNIGPTTDEWGNKTYLPTNVGSEIMCIYDHGITFWNPQCEVGKYSLYDNSPT